MFAGLFRNFAEKIKDAIRPDFYIKIGIILLGTSIQWTDLMDAGLAALCQSIIVVVGVWAFAFWVGKQFKLDDEFNVILASAVSICGLSAAIIITSAINGDKKKTILCSKLSNTNGYTTNCVCTVACSLP